MSKRLSILILTRNERHHIQRCLQSVKELNASIFVVDSNSTDGTADLAYSLGAKVVYCNEPRFSDKLNWALSNVEFESEWIMRLDADEFLSTEIKLSLLDLLSGLPDRVSGLIIRRQIWFMGQWIKYGGIYPSWTLRIWRNGMVVCESRDLDEHMILLEGKAMQVSFDIIDSPLTDLSSWTEKHNLYATIEANSLFNESARGSLKPRIFGSKVERVRWAKNKIFYRMPLLMRPFLYFVYRFFFRFGFLDGKKGFIFHFLHGFWYRLLIDAKIIEIRDRK